MARKARLAKCRSPARRRGGFYELLRAIDRGRALTFLLARAGLFYALPATWLLLYGVSFVGSGGSPSASCCMMGSCFMILGIVACFVPLALGNALLGAASAGCTSCSDHHRKELRG